MSNGELVMKALVILAGSEDQKNRLQRASLDLYLYVVPSNIKNDDTRKDYEELKPKLSKESIALMTKEEVEDTVEKLVPILYWITYHSR